MRLVPRTHKGPWGCSSHLISSQWACGLDLILGYLPVNSDVTWEPNTGCLWTSLPYYWGLNVKCPPQDSYVWTLGPQGYTCLLCFLLHQGDGDMRRWRVPLHTLSPQICLLTYFPIQDGLYAFRLWAKIKSSSLHFASDQIFGHGNMKSHKCNHRSVWASDSWEGFFEEGFHLSTVGSSIQCVMPGNSHIRDTGYEC